LWARLKPRTTCLVAIITSGAGHSLTGSLLPNIRSGLGPDTHEVDFTSIFMIRWRASAHARLFINRRL
ncbi:MAG: hypothetical protein KAW81_00535, partial [Dehalococcoidia bacterium]|nr:hypothetical protein [Dehalococcoidia bacterium]